MKHTVNPDLSPSSPAKRIKIDSQEVSIPEKIREASERFRKNEGNWLISYCQHIELDGIHFYGIHKGNQHLEQPSDTRKAYQEMKSHMLQYMGQSPETQVVQFVGDSTPFSIEGTKAVQEKMHQHLETPCVVQYGYTGSHKPGGRFCVNAALSEIIEQEHLVDRVIANVVGYHTPVALSKYKCSGPLLKHYVVVYSDVDDNRQEGTVFGDDVIASDYFADELVMFEGGAQSFKHACDALYLGQQIHAYTGIRGEEIQSVQEGDTVTPYFNGVTFLQDIRDYVAQTTDVSKEDLQGFYQRYFGKGKHYIVDVQRSDYKTKEGLLNRAWDLFLREKLYKKLDLITIH